MSNIERLGEELAKVKRKYPEFSFVRTTRRARDPEFYKLYINGDWIGELWDNQEGHLWTNLVSEKEKAKAPYLLRGKTLQNPTTQDDVLYIKDTYATGGFKCAMKLSSVTRTYDVMESMIMTYKGKDSNLGCREYQEVVPQPASPTASKVKKSVVTEKDEYKPIVSQMSRQGNETVTNSAVKKVKRRKVL